MTRHYSTTLSAQRTDCFNRYTHLTLGERARIQTLLESHCSLHQIAKYLHRAVSTISREIKRGTTQLINVRSYLPYSAYIAEMGQTVYRQHRQNCVPIGLLAKCHTFFLALDTALLAKPRIYSVDTFIHRYARSHPKQRLPSVPTIYRYIDEQKLRTRNLDLPLKPRLRIRNGKRKHTAKNKKILGESIEDRPEEAADRLEPTNWEMDLVKGKRETNQPALMTLTERATRYELIIKISDYRAATCLKTLQQVIDYYGPAAFHTITADNGAEFSQLHNVKGTTVFFCHPYTPSERGTNENTNGQIREFIPKGHSIAEYSTEFIQMVQDTLNARPRECLGYDTPTESMQELSENLQGTLADSLQ